MKMAIGQFLAFSDTLWLDLNQITKEPSNSSRKQLVREAVALLWGSRCTPPATYSCWATVGIPYFSHDLERALKLAYHKLNQDLAIQKCMIPSLAQFQLALGMIEGNRYRLREGCYKHQTCFPSLSSPSLSSSPGQLCSGHTALSADGRW